MPQRSQRLSGVLDRISSHDASIGHRPVPPRVVRAVEHAVAVEHGRAMVQAARVRGVGYVSHESLLTLGSLAMDQALSTRRTPHVAAAMQLIVETAGVCMAEIVHETGLG